MTFHPKKIRFLIKEEQQNIRIDKVLSSIPEIGSRTQAQNLIELQKVFVNNKQVKASYILQFNDSISIEIPAPEDHSKIHPYNIPLEIHYEDEDVLVVNKPAPLVVHPSHGHHSDTLVNALVYHAKDLSMGFSEQRPGIVHRLDKETSGLLVVAKNNFSQEFLAQQFKNRSIHRLYWALCFGDFKNKENKITSQLARHPTHRKKFSSTLVGGKIAITNYKVLETSPKHISLVECKLETGRTHQIRVHLSELGHPVIGDALYGSNSRLQQISSQNNKQTIQGLSRIALHAKELGFVHPKTREPLFFTSEFPKELKELALSLGVQSL